MVSTKKCSIPIFNQLLSWGNRQRGIAVCKRIQLSAAIEILQRGNLTQCPSSLSSNWGVPDHQNWHAKHIGCEIQIDTRSILGRRRRLPRLRIPCTFLPYNCTFCTSSFDFPCLSAFHNLGKVSVPLVHQQSQPRLVLLQTP